MWLVDKGCNKEQQQTDPLNHSKLSCRQEDFLQPCVETADKSPHILLYVVTIIKEKGKFELTFWKQVALLWAKILSSETPKQIFLPCVRRSFSRPDNWWSYVCFRWKTAFRPLSISLDLPRAGQSTFTPSQQSAIRKANIVDFMSL